MNQEEGSNGGKGQLVALSRIPECAKRMATESCSEEVDSCREGRVLFHEMPTMWVADGTRRWYRVRGEKILLLATYAT